MIQTTILQTNFGAAALHANLQKQGIYFEVKKVGEKLTPLQIMERCLNLCCEWFAVDIKKIKIKSRRREYVVARASFYYIIRTQHPNISLKKIGNFAGGFDHSTVIHGKDYISDCIHGVARYTQENKNITRIVKEIISEL